MTKILGLILTLICYQSYSAELVHQFNSPSFSGVGFSSHALTINQLETQASEKSKAAAAAIQAKAEAAALNKPEAKFLANLESRIYSQLAKQLTDSMFSEGNTCNTNPGEECGRIPDLGGNTVTWKLGAGEDQGMIVIDIVSNTNHSQSTSMKVPAGTFYF